jgi:hypothetical protein
MTLGPGDFWPVHHQVGCQRWCRPLGGDVVVVFVSLSVVRGVVVVGAFSVDVATGGVVVVVALSGNGAAGEVVVVDALPHTGSPGSGASSGPPARNTAGVHTPRLPLPAQAHQWLARCPTEYVDPSDWHMNGYRLGGREARGWVVPGRYAGAV